MTYRELIRKATLGIFSWRIDRVSGAIWFAFDFPPGRCRKLWPANDIARAERNG